MDVSSRGIPQHWQINFWGEPKSVLDFLEENKQRAVAIDILPPVGGKGARTRRPA